MIDLGNPKVSIIVIPLQDAFDEIYKGSSFGRNLIKILEKHPWKLKKRVE